MPIKLMKLDRYIAREIIQNFAGSMILFVFIFLMFQILRLSDFFIVHGVAIQTLFKMMFYLVISFIPLAVPVSILIAVIFGFGRLSAESELIAMKSCGISLARLSLAPISIATALSLMSVLLFIDLVPLSDAQFRTLVAKAAHTKAVTALKEGTFTSGFFDLLVFADKVEPKTNRLEHVFIFDERKPSNPLTIIAKEGYLLPLKTGSDFGSAVVLQLLDGNIHQIDSKNETYQRINFGDYKLFLEVDEAKMGLAQDQPRRLIFSKLIESLKGESSFGTPHARVMRTEIWRRITSSLMPIIFALLGVALGTFRSRSVRMGGLLITIVVISVSWTLQVWSIHWAQSGKLPPEIAMCLPLLLFLTLGLESFKRASW